MDYKSNYEERTKRNIAEEKCEEYLSGAGFSFLRNGFNQPEISKEQFWMLPQNIRKQPDYIVFQNKAVFLEVKGCKDILRLKIEDIKSYDFWKQSMPISFFLYSTEYNEIKLVSYKSLKVLTTIAPIDRYPDNNKEYFKIDWGAID